MDVQHTQQTVPAEQDPRYDRYYSASFAKPRETIQVVDHDLTGNDRKLFNVLLYRSQHMLKQDPHQLFAARTADLRKGIGQRRHGHTEISESLERLQKTVVRLDYYNKGKLRQRRMSLLITTDVPKMEGVVLWQFHPELAPRLANPDSYARVYLTVSAGLRSGYAIRLYDQIALAATTNTEWRVPVNELRDLLGATAPSYAEFMNFKAKVLNPAMREIQNADLPYHVRMRYERDDNRFVTHIIFTIEPKPEWTPQLEDLGDGDPDAVHILEQEEVDSLLDQAAPGHQRQPAVNPRRAAQSAQPDAIERIVRRIKDETMARLRADYPALDIDATVREWAGWSLAQGRDVRRPKDELLRYVAVFYGHLKGRAPESIGADEMELSQELVTALCVISDMNVRQRRGWLAAAVRLNPDIDVPDLSPDYFMHWVPTIVDSLRSNGRLPGAPSAQQELDFAPNGKSAA